MSKEFDLIIYGATGFTGKLATLYLMNSESAENLSVAIAGRSESKLKLLQESCKIKPATIVADSANQASIDSMVQKTKVLLSFAGPFALYGEPIIAACAKYGVDYLDITGETLFIRKMIEKYQEQAQGTGARLIPFSGFDSVPADLTVYLALKIAKAQGFNIDSMSFYYKLKGGLNGGTLATALYQPDYKNSGSLFNPNNLIFDEAWPKGKINKSLKPNFESYIKRWAVPFFMGPINNAVVRRSTWLRSKLGEKSNEFNYQERLIMSEKFGYAKSLLSVGALAGFGLLAKSSLGRKFIENIGPKPGEGPSDEVRENGYVKGQLICRSNGDCKLAVSIERKGDPGNNVTVALAIESAKLAAENAFKTDLKGFITPSVAFGDELVARLKKTDFVFETKYI